MIKWAQVNSLHLQPIFYFMYEILKQKDNGSLKRFKEIYEEDRFKARIFALENSPHSQILAWNFIDDYCFQIFCVERKYGVSTTLKIYSRNKTIVKFLINKTKFYRVQGKTLFPLCITNTDTQVFDIIVERFTWMRFLKENTINDISFNTIVRLKLYSLKKVIFHMYGCSIECGLKIKEVITYRDWKIYKKNLTNIINITPEFIAADELRDTMSLAFKLNEKVNAAWSPRRLKEEHDRMAKKYTDIVHTLNDRPLNIHPVFVSLNTVIGGLLTTTKDLALEGAKQSHCVANYSQYVDSGRSAIFNIDGYTAEVIKKTDGLYINQFKGFKNKDALEDLKASVSSKINEFISENKHLLTLVHQKVDYNDYFTEQLPF